MKKLLLLFCIAASFAVAQKRYVVSPYGEPVPIREGETALQAAQRSGIASGYAACDNKESFGFNIADYPRVTDHIAFHKDVIGVWFEAPASGTIDTIYWAGSNDVCVEDSTMYLRIHNSNVYTGHGPGYDGYPLPSSSTCWGYYNNTNDIESQIAAFPDDATPPVTWISTLADTSLPPSYPPTGTEIWGLGGFPVIQHSDGGLTNINHQDLSILGAPSVEVGDKFFVSFRMNGDSTEVCSGTSGLNTGFNINSPIDDLLTHNWKFYERVVTFQAGFVCKGWVARGDFHVLFWYTMTVTTNVAPDIITFDRLQNTLEQGPRTVVAEIEDCDAEDEGSAGVASALIQWEVDGVSQAPISLESVGPNLWGGDLPGQSPNSTVRYRIFATDLKGLTDSTAYTAYKIVELRNEFYYADTSYDCTSMDIVGTGTQIDTSRFFNPLTFAGGATPGDDGTAGPFDLGGPMIFFGDSVRYAWVGVNGALALSNSATDTLDVNANGFYSGWDLPNAQHDNRADSAGLGDTPPNFIAAYWADHIIGDTTGTYGSIYRKTDGCKFIVEWNEVGAFFASGVSPDLTKFRTILDRCEQTIEVQIDHAGTNDQNLVGLMGMQADSNKHPGAFILVNSSGYPEETRLRNNMCIKYYPTISTAVSGWSLVSVGGDVTAGIETKEELYPTAVSQAFRYEGSYQLSPSLTNGPGYWLKFDGAQTVEVPSIPKFEADIAVNNLWNLIGSISKSVPTASITSTPNGLVASPYYGYNGAYAEATTIEPGKAYWVKANANGTLHLNAASAMPKSGEGMYAQLSRNEQVNTLTIRDSKGRSQTLYLGNEKMLNGQSLSAYELPPVPPVGGMDARFTSQRLVETYPSEIDRTKKYEYAVAIQSDAYPLEVSWQMGRDGKSFLMTDMSGSVSEGSLGTAILANSGSMKIEKSDVQLLKLTLTEGLQIPKEFALSQNYPNPFNPSTRMSVELPMASKVDVTVYDLLGRKVATLLAGEIQAGYHTIEWQGKDASGFGVPSGIYFIRMTTDQEFSSTRKVMLMK